MFRVWDGVSGEVPPDCHRIQTLTNCHCTVFSQACACTWEQMFSSIVYLIFTAVIEWLSEISTDSYNSIQWSSCFNVWTVEGQIIESVKALLCFSLGVSSVFVVSLSCFEHCSAGLLQCFAIAHLCFHLWLILGCLPLHYLQFHLYYCGKFGQHVSISCCGLLRLCCICSWNSIFVCLDIVCT